MIIIDYNQIGIGALMAHMNGSKSEVMDTDLVRHMILNTLRSYKAKYGDEYGDLVIACDNRRYWRRSVFPQYKASRKKTRESSGYDWASIFQGLSMVKHELQQHMPYPVIDVDGAEADDVIGTLCAYSQDHDLTDHPLFPDAQRLLIVSPRQYCANISYAVTRAMVYPISSVVIIVLLMAYDRHLFVKF